MAGKKRIRLCTVVMAVFVMMLMPLTATATEKVHLNVYSKKIMVGESFKLKAVNTSGRRVYFSSSNKKIATVSSKGVVRGKKRGTVTIKVRVGAKRYECKVTVQTTQDSYMTQVRKLINLERRNYGRPALDYNKYLDAAAKKRAKELDQKYSHTRPDGTSWTSAISLKYNYGKNYYEIIANGLTTPEAVVAAWMKSKSTKPAIVGKVFEDIGVGYYVADDGTDFWCVIVAAEK